MPRPAIGRFGAVFMLLMMASMSLAACASSVAIPPQSVPGSRMPTQPLLGEFTLPGGKGPFPAMIVLHGCSGRGPSQDIWAQRLNGWGYAALIPDSYSPRGFTGNCVGLVGQRPITPRARAGDVISAALWLHTRPEIDGARIGVIGFSNGGVTAESVTQRRYEQLYPGLLKASVAYYGGCSHPEEHGTVPLLVLVGEADDWGFPARGCRAFGAALTPGPIFEIHTYPGAVHSFDNMRAVQRSWNQGHPMQYDFAAAQDSFEWAKTFLDRYMGHRTD
jgi:dienelactone hydrolase